MASSSTDLKKMSTVALMDQANKLQFPLNLCVNTGVGLVVIAFSLFKLMGLEDFWLLPVFFALIAFSGAGLCYYRIRQIKKELSTRDISQEEKASAKAHNKKMRTKFIVIMLALAAVCLLFAQMDYSSNSDDTTEGKCRNCGRTKNIVPGFNMCSSCYEGFVDWQEDYYATTD